MTQFIQGMLNHHINTTEDVLIYSNEPLLIINRDITANGNDITIHAKHIIFINCTIRTIEDVEQKELSNIKIYSEHPVQACNLTVYAAKDVNINVTKASATNAVKGYNSLQDLVQEIPAETIQYYIDSNNSEVLQALDLELAGMSQLAYNIF
jgi:hypothetical protein